MKPRFGTFFFILFYFFCRGEMGNLWASIFIFCLWICITFQNLLCKTGYHITDKRTVVFYRILTFIKCLYTWNKKLRFWAKIVTMWYVVNKWSIMVAAILLITLNISMASDLILKRNIFIKKFLKWWNLTFIDHPGILGNGRGIPGQNYIKLLQGSGITAGYHYRNWILCNMLF